jgi:hypothetical protein
MSDYEHAANAARDGHRMAAHKHARVPAHKDEYGDVFLVAVIGVV